MTDLEDHQIVQAEVRAGREAVRLVQQLHPFNATPRRDDAGVMRLGFGRPIEARPMPEETGLHWLRSDMVRVQSALRMHVYELLALHPDAEKRLPYLYAIADLLGPEMIREHAPLWSAMRKGEWAEVAKEIMDCQWERYYGATPEKRKAVMGLVLAVAAPETLA